MKRIKSKKRTIILLIIILIILAIIATITVLKKNKDPKEIKLDEFTKIFINDSFSKYLKYIDILNSQEDIKHLSVDKLIVYGFYYNNLGGQTEIKCENIVKTINDIFKTNFNEDIILLSNLSEYNLIYDIENKVIKKTDDIEINNIYNAKFINSIYQISQNEYKMLIDIVEPNDVQKLMKYYETEGKTIEDLMLDKNSSINDLLTIENYKELSTVKDTAEMIIEVNNGKIKIKSYKTL